MWRATLSLYSAAGLLSLALNQCYAGDMNTSMEEGYSAAQTAGSQAQSSIGGVQPQQYFEHYDANPPQSGYYQGGTQTDTSLGAKGQQELGTSEMGQLARESFINNPSDKIDWDSDMMKNVRNIQQNADVIAAGTGPQCVKQAINKVSYSSHSCQQAKSVEADCRREAHIETRSKVVKKQKTVAVSVPMQSSWSGRWNGQLVIPEKARLLRVAVRASGMPIPYSQACYYQWNGKCQASVGETFSIMGRALPVKVDALPNHSEQCSGGKNDHCTHRYNDGSSSVNQTFDVDMAVSAGQAFAVVKTSKTTGVRQPAGFTVNVTLTLEVEENVADPVVVWTEACTADKANDVQLSSQCVSPGGNRVVQVGGQSYTLYQDCWAYKDVYQVYESDDNTCSTYENDRNCTVGTRTCLRKVGMYCVMESLTYQCQHTVSSEGWVCGSQFFCSDGKCSAIKNDSNNDFQGAVSQLAALAAAGKDVSGMDPDKVRAFTGKGMSCRKSALGFSNCCKSSGWGQDVGLAQCNDEEKSIGKAKEKLLTVDIGEFCAKKVLGVCLQKKHSYCVFDSKLARIVQQQGREGQLHIGFGSAKSPDCRGVNMDELQRIQFDHLDFTDFYDELQSNVALPDQKQLTDRISDQIKNSLQQSGGK
ncbi:TPA: type-F conjugative transfer system mating-pair stabilization protein TraN [Serratia marcescens]|uniref:type-F conjugative transfer system mating-pair stabilization protein TraN n=1 Tax=Serratia TaxID=613 RepID=UPI00101F64EB|nr:MULTISPECIES: type-F conjugative transfer system mating-pair stabilization protein TraN [Serratia]RYM48277.1 type-F conjugative transfer system mating-pair stabilization protein TraN [Serratia proteamaculans]